MGPASPPWLGACDSMTAVNSEEEATALAQAMGQEDDDNLSAAQSRALSLLRDVSLLPVLVLLIVAGALMSPVFLQSSNFWGIGQYASSIALITAGGALAAMVSSRGHSPSGP